MSDFQTHCTSWCSKRKLDTKSPSIMKFILLLAVVAFVAAEHATIDHIHLSNITGNVSIVNSFFRCFADDGDCNSDANDIKQMMPKVFETSCAECHPDDKHKLAVILKAGQDLTPEAYDNFVVKYDPERKHQTDLQKFIDEHK